MEKVKVRFNLYCVECGSTNSYGVHESSLLKWCPNCQKNTMHYHNDSYIISESEIIDKVNKMIEEDENNESKRD